MKEGFLSIGMPVYDDFDGVFFTIQALRLYHPEIFEKSEIIVVDNNPNSPYGLRTANFCNGIARKYKNIKYIKFTERYGTAPAKQKAIEEATGEWYLGCDCHVLFPPGVLDRLVKYMEEHPDSKDILCGPVLLDDGSVSTHFAYKWRGQNLGIWTYDKRAQNPDAEPFEIIGTGMGAFACRREAWPGFHPEAYGFGGEEIYIHEKFRRNGGRALLLPFFRWVHRFGSGATVRYPLKLWHKVRNYVLEFMELGWDLNELKEYYVGGGYMKEEDWDFLLLDPVNHVNPPETIAFASDEQRLPNIKHWIENRKNIVPNSTIEEQEAMKRAFKQSIQELELQQKPKNTDNQEDSIPPQQPELETVILSMEELKKTDLIPEEAKQRILEAFQKNPPLGEEPKIRLMIPKRQANGKSGCSGCGKAKEALKPREDIIKELQKLSSLQEVVSRKLPNLLGENADTLKQYLAGQKLILEIGDDPYGTTLNILTNMDKDATLVSYYQDHRYVPELELLRRLAEKEERTFAFNPFDPAAFQLQDEVDLAVIDLMDPSFEMLNSVFERLKGKIKNRIIIHKTAKYGIMAPENKLGLSPGITKFLMDNQEWSVVKYSVKEQGLVVMSSVQEDKPKIQRSSFSMLKSFAKAMATHIATGGKEVDKETLRERLEICAACSLRIDNRCSVCGCFLVDGIGGTGKAKMRHESCPYGFWRAVKD